MIVAIDGPAGAGKSSVARTVAAALGFGFLDTGALYRATALASIMRGEPASEIAGGLKIELGSRVLLDGQDVTARIRDAEVTSLTHQIAKDPKVRAALTALQRELIHSGDWVAEGRDIGTVVAPDAEVKIFLTASLEERARRRAAEHGEVLKDVRRQMSERDAADQGRAHAPLVAAEDAVVVDTTSLSFEEVVGFILNLVPARDHIPGSLFARTPADI